MRKTNYTRQATLYAAKIHDMLRLNPKLDDVTKKHTQLIGAAMHYAIQGVKFILPDGGQVIADPKFKAFPFGNIRLPFPLVTLEYFEPSQKVDLPHATPAHKRIVVAQECLGTDGAEYIRIWPIWYNKENAQWIFQDPICIPRNIAPDEVWYVGEKLFIKRTHLENYTGTKYSSCDYIGEIATLLSFLAALGCNNVAIEKTEKNPPVPKRSKGDAIPFDEYHTLVIRRSQQGSSEVGGSHRSPREHLRRGHIRQLSNGEKTWVNACVVNAGTLGKVRKDYSFYN